MRRPGGLLSLGLPKGVRVKAVLAIDRAVHRAEKWLAGMLFLAMALIMFVSVTHRVFSREEGRFSGFVLSMLRKAGVEADPATVHGPVSAVLNVALVFGVVYLALSTRRQDQPISNGRALGMSAVVTLALAAAVKLVLVALPNGIVWGPVVSLCCMLWVAFLGASIATYEKQHLALEMGEKLWPAKAMPVVRRLAMAVTTLFCVLLLVLSLYSIEDHYSGWVVNHLAGNLLPTEIPKWVVFMVLPYTFLVMTLRFAGSVVSGVTSSGDNHGIPIPSGVVEVGVAAEPSVDREERVS